MKIKLDIKKVIIIGLSTSDSLEDVTGWTGDNITMSCQTNLRPNQSIIWIRNDDHDHSEVIAHDENILVAHSASSFKAELKRNLRSSGVNALLTVSPYQ